MAVIGNTYLNLRYGQKLASGDASDTIYGYLGNDIIYAGGGNDVIYGGTGNDLIYAGSQWNPTANAYWGWDYVEGGANNDVINYSGSLSNYNLIYGDSYTSSSSDGADRVTGGFGIDTIYGGGSTDTIVGDFGNDTIYGDYASTAFSNDGGDWISGDQGSDRIYGGGGHDTIYGGADNDTIYGDFSKNFTNDGADYIDGGSGSDTIYGGGGNDVIVGGTGADWLTGGAGFDTFRYTTLNDSTGWGNSGSTWSNADTIIDFNSAYDSIDLRGYGTSANYAETSFVNQGWTQQQRFSIASNKAESFIQYSNKQFVFVTDGIDGYLFADQDGNHVMDTRIELDGVSSLSGFAYWDLV